MTGMAAARLMVDAGVGILRTLPAPDGALVARLRRQARALSVPWPDEQPHGELLAGLDRSDPAQLTLLHAAGSLFRGAGYTALGAGVEAEAATHAAVAAPYAHVTAPLRRLVDRFGLVVAHSLCAGRPVPAWVLEALPDLPGLMAASDQLAGRFERACLDTVEAAVLSHRVGEVFTAVVVDVSQPKDGSPGTGKVQLLSPAVLASCAGPLERGTHVRVRLAQADPGTGTVRFVPETAPAAAPDVATGAGQG
jgi:exoribonuclease R